MEAAVYFLAAIGALGVAVYLIAALVARAAMPRLGSAAAGYRARPSAYRNYAQRR